MSPGTDDTHTMGSEDSSIASHFADGVLEATPTSPLSTCDDRSITSTATTPGPGETGPIAVTSFAGVTKVAPLTADTGETIDMQTESGNVKISGSPSKIQSLPKMQVSPKAQGTAKVLQPAAKAQTPPKAQVATKVSPAPKVPSPTKVQILSKLPSPQKPPTMINKVQTLPKARSHHKVQTTSKVQHLTPEVTITPNNSLTSVTVSVQSSKDVPPSSSQNSRVIQSVETVKPAPPQELDASAIQVIPIQGNGQVLHVVSTSSQIISTSQLVSSSSQMVSIAPQIVSTPQLVSASQLITTVSSAPQLVSVAPQMVSTASQGVSTIAQLTSTSPHLERALQSKQASQTPLLARALKTPSGPLPTTFTGILNTSTRLSISQPQTSQLRALPKVPESNQQMQNLELTASTPVSQSTLARGEGMPTPVTDSQSLPLPQQTTPATSAVLQEQPSQIEQLCKIEESPATDGSAQPETGLQSIQMDMVMGSNQNLTTNLLTLPTEQPESQPTAALPMENPELKPQPQILAAPMVEPPLQTQIDGKGTEDVHKVQPLPQVKSTSSTVQLHQSSNVTQGVAQNQMTALASQPILQDQSLLCPPSSMQSTVALQQALTTQILQSEPQADVVQPSLQIDEGSEAAQSVPQLLQSMSGGQLTNLNLSAQIIEQASSSIQLPSQLVHDVQPEQMVQTEGSTKMIQISSQVSPPTSMMQAVAEISPLSSATQVKSAIDGVTQLVQSRSQVQGPTQLVESAHLTQVIPANTQVVQSVSQSSLPQLVQSSKPLQSSPQRLGIQPVQLSSNATASQLRRVSGDFSPHLVQISQPSLVQTLQTTQLQSHQSGPSSQAVSMVSSAFSTQKQVDVEVGKVTSPPKQNLVPLYMVPSSSSSQLPVMISSATGMVPTATGMVVVNSPSGLVVRQLSKQDNKLSGDSTHDTYVISCEPSQPLLVSTIQQLFSGSAPVVSTAHLNAAMTNQTSPIMSTQSFVSDSTDATVLSINSATVSNDIPVNINPLISSGSPRTQLYPSLTSTTQTTASSVVLDVPIPTVSQAAPRAVTPSSTSNISPPVSTLTTGSPPRPQTLLALQNQSRLVQLQQIHSEQMRMQEEKAAKDEKQNIEHLRRSLALQQQQQLQQGQGSQPQQQPPQSNVTQLSLPQPAPEVQQISTAQCDSQQISQTVTILQSSELKKSPQKQVTRLSPQKAKEETVAVVPVIISRTKNRPIMGSVPPQFMKTKPTQLIQLLEQPQAPLPPPPLYRTVVRRLSDPISVASGDSSNIVASPPKQQEEQLKNSDEKTTETVPPVIEFCKPSVESSGDSGTVPTALPSESLVTHTSPMKDSSSSTSTKCAPPEDMGSSEELPTVHIQAESLPLPIALPQPADSSTVLPPTISPQIQLTTTTEPPIVEKLIPEPLKEQTSTTGEELSKIPERQLVSSCPEEQIVPFPAENQISLVLPEKPSTEKTPGSSPPEKLLSAPSTEMLTPALVPLRLLSSPEKLSAQSLAVSVSTSTSLSPPQLSTSKGKIYAVVQSKAPVVGLSQKLTPTKSPLKLSPGVKAMVFSPTGSERYIGDAVVLGQSESPSPEAFCVRGGLSNSNSKNTDGESEQAVVVATLASASGPTNETVNFVPRQHSAQLPRLNLLSKFSTQTLHQKVQQLPISEAPPLAPVSSSKVSETPSLKTSQLGDLNVNSRSRVLQSGLPVHLYSDVKPVNSSEVRVYPPSQGCVDADRIPSSPKVKPTVLQLSTPVTVTPPLVLTSVQVTTSSSSASPAKGRTTVPMTYSAVKTSPKIQNPTQTSVQLLTAVPLQLQKPVLAKAQTVIHQQQILQSPGTSTLKLQTTTPVLIPSPTTAISTSEVKIEDGPNVSPKPKRQRNRKRSLRSSQEKEPSPPRTSTVETELSVPNPKPQLPSPSKNTDCGVSPPKRPNKKKESTPTKQLSPLVSQHMNDAIMRVSLGADAEELQSTSNEQLTSLVMRETENSTGGHFDAPLVDDVYYEDQEKIPVEVAVAALCGEDIEIAKDLIDGNLHGDMKRRGSITLLPADPSDNTEELNYTFRNVISKTPNDDLNTEAQESSIGPDGDSVTSSDLKKDSSIMSSLAVLGNESSDVADLDSVKKETEQEIEVKEDEEVVVSCKIAQKRKATSHTGSFSEQSRSLSGSDDLSMDKTSTSDIFPEPDLLFETTLSPSFLGEIAQLSPTNSQDAVCASPDPLDKKKRCFTVKTAPFHKAQTATHEIFSEAVPKVEQDESKDSSVNKTLSSIDSLNQFNGATTTDNTFLETQNSHLSVNESQASMSNSNQILSGMAGSSSEPAFFSLKPSSRLNEGRVPSIDEASWEGEPLYASQSSDNENDDFWRKTLASGVDLNQEGDTNSSSTPSESLTKTGKSSGRIVTRRSTTPQASKGNLKRKDESAGSPAQKQSGEKRKRMSSLVSSNDEEESSKYSSVLRSRGHSTSNTSKKEVAKGSLKEDSQVQRRVSRRTHKPVTKFDEPQKKAKPSPKQSTKAVAHKKK